MENTKSKSDWPFVGNRHIAQYLKKSAAGGQAGGAFIFNGPDNLGKTTAAVHFAKILLCQERAKGGDKACGTCPICQRFDRQPEERTEEEAGEDEASRHSDLHIIKPAKDKKNISIEQVRGFIRTLRMSSFLNSYKIGIIKHADRMSTEAANAILKTLEEPNEKVVIILITHNMELLPQTIVSRSQVLRFAPVSFDDIYEYLTKEKGVSRATAKTLARLSLGRPALALKFFEDKEFYDKYLKQVNVFVDFFSQDINGRFSAISDLLGGKTSGQEAARLSGRALEVWQGIIRDWLLLAYGRPDIVQHLVIEKELRVIQKNKQESEALRLYGSITEAQEQLRANVNPKLVLEGIAVAI